MSSNEQPVTALTFHRFCGSLDLRNWIRRLDLYRYVEYPVSWSHLSEGLSQRAQFLAVGSATSVLPLFLASQGCQTTSIDIDDVTAQKQRRLLARMEGRLFRSGLLRFENQDVRALSYADRTFDTVTAISMLEHIPDDGDSKAMCEMARVLRPGGKLILTCPFSPERFDSGKPPYSSSRTQRVYDDQAVTTRLVAPSGLEVRARLYFSNRWLDFEKWWRRIPQAVINGVGWTGLALVSSRWFFAPTLRPEAMGARAICMVLVK